MVDSCFVDYLAWFDYYKSVQGTNRKDGAVTRTLDYIAENQRKGGGYSAIGRKVVDRRTLYRAIARMEETVYLPEDIYVLLC